MITRDPARIEEMLEYLRRIWVYQPDTRLAQLLINTANTGETMPKLYNLEDDKLRRLLKEKSEQLSKQYLKD
jgi:uncharacterized protein YihD (DUF1040 family)